MEHEHADATVAESDALMAEVIGTLARISRLPTSPGEQRAAGMICDRFEAADCVACVEEVPAAGFRSRRG